MKDSWFEDPKRILGKRTIKWSNTSRPRPGIGQFLTSPNRLDPMLMKAIKFPLIRLHFHQVYTLHLIKCCTINDMKNRCRWRELYMNVILNQK